MDNYINIINNNINLLNCIFKKYKYNYEFSLKKDNDNYFLENFDNKENKIIYTSEKVKLDKLIVLNYAIENVLLDNIEKLKWILEKHKKMYIENNIENILGY